MRPKGAVIAFRADRFANPAGLVAFIQKNAVAWRLRPDRAGGVEIDEVGVEKPPAA